MQKIIEDTHKLLIELDTFVWSRTDEEDDKMIEKLKNHIIKQNVLIQDLIREDTKIRK